LSGQLMVNRMSLPILWILLILSGSAAAQKNAIRLASPNGQIVFTLRVADTASYNVSYRNRPIITNSSMSFSFLEMGEFKKNLKVTRPVFRKGEEKYELIVGKSRFVHQPFQEAMIPIEQTKPPFAKINLQVRAFDDGIAFRYEFPLQKGFTQLTLTDEHTNFKMAGDPDVLALLLPNYTTSHEGEYTHSSLSKLKEDTLVDMPALFIFPGPTYVAITEAALLDYAGMYLAKEKNILTSMLSPLPGQTEVKVKAKLPHYSPWRVFMISDRVGALIESNILTSLNEPCKITDLSWIKPGKTTFPWWNGNVVPDTLNAPGNNFVTNQYYIDFCSRNGLAYHSVVEYGLHQWYMDDGVNFQPGPHADVTTPVPGLDMKQICDYAKQHGVDIRVWVHWAALYPKLDTAFAIFENWGIKGMMVDFMDRDDQEMVNIQTEIVQKAAQHHLHIQFHGAYKPTGASRTWPNEFTREGTLNYEVNKWDKRITPDHDLNIVFTRMLAGPTDYHLGGFRAVPDSLFRVQYTRPLMLGTRCHMLAMYVVLQNPLGMVCDYPAAYEGQPGFDFIREVPTTWDDTKVINARVGEYIVIARKKGDNWFVGAITNHSERVIKIPLQFLDDAKYATEIYSDAADVNIEPNHLQQESKNVINKDVLSVRLAAGGGMVMHLRKIN
jgi:alpha-glucosidase